MAGPTQITPATIGSAPVGRGASQGLNSKDPRAMRQSAQEFEAMFLSQMFGHVFESLKTDGAFGGGHAEKVYRSLLVDEYGKTMARAGGIGIADSVLAQMLRNQEMRSKQVPEEAQQP
jgi:peptidoglycan hydrolase FlgJ